MTMAQTDEQTIQTMRFEKEIEIAAPPDAVFAAVLDELGPEGQMPPDGRPFPMKIEPWPGGRWYRDLGNNTGHLWGHVQVIKPPTLLELCGPMPMSYAATNHLQYRLTAEGQGKTRLRLTHTAIGLIPPEHRAMDEGWAFGLNRIRELAERRTGGRGTKR
jgi:uncharacterized protein YndB with AHSA1/START domain